MILDRPRCFLMHPGRIELTSVTQTSHKEHMRIEKRMHEAGNVLILKSQGQETMRSKRTSISSVQARP
jgi:hypothetical protein